MNTRREEALVAASDAEPVAGEVVSIDAVVPTTGSENAKNERARGRTSLQAGIPGASIIIFEWLCALAKLDLDPYSDGTGLPGAVAGALTAVATVAIAFRMNPVKKR